MVKIVEEEEDQSESNSRRFSLDTSPPHTPSPRPSTSSSHNQYHHSNNNNNHPSSPPSHPPGSPDSSSSISSDHTFHGFSANPSPHPTSPHEPEPRQSPFSSPMFLKPSPSPPAIRPMRSVKTAVLNRLIRDEPPASVSKTEAGAVTGFADAGAISDYEAGGDGRTGGGGEGRGLEGGGRGRTSSSSAIQRSTKVIMLKRVALGLRWFEFVVCLISFSVMAADRNRGWALDSFDRYKEFRYSMSVNVIAFVYSGLQGCSMACQVSNGKHSIRSVTGCYFDFMVDQALAYLLASASSSAATRVDDWMLNWGKDIFPTMAGASVGVSFVAFLAFAVSSIMSGYLLCTHRST